MHLKYYKAKLQEGCREKNIYCLHLNSLFFCCYVTNEIYNPLRYSIKSDTDFMGEPYIVYCNPNYIDELSRNGYDVQESEIALPVDEGTLNEFDLTYCKDSEYSYAFYIFENLAIRFGLEGFEVFFQDNISLSDITEHWECMLDKTTLEVICKIPKDTIGTLAINIDSLLNQCWHLMGCPGLECSEEDKLCGLKIHYDLLLGGDNLKSTFESQAETLIEYMDEISKFCQSGDDVEFYTQQLVKAKELLAAIYSLQAECQNVTNTMKI